MVTKTNAGPDSRNLYQRLNAVMKKVGYVQKESERVNNQYRFVSHDAVVGALRGPIIDEGIFVETTVTKLTQDGNRTVAEVQMSFVNIDNPEDQLTISCYGYGIDGQDKGPGKSISYAVKYGLLKNLLLETGDDPERDDVNYRPATPAQATPAVPVAPKGERKGNGHDDKTPEQKIVEALRLQAAAHIREMNFSGQELVEAIQKRYGVGRFADMTYQQAQVITNDLERMTRIWKTLLVNTERMLHDSTYREEPIPDGVVAEEAQKYLYGCAPEGKPLLASLDDWQAWQQMMERHANERS